MLGLQGRGTIRTGFAADLLLFDPKTVARGPKRRVHDLPAGAARLTTDAVGVHGVWVNGAQVADARGLVELDAARRRAAHPLRRPLSARDARAVRAAVRIDA